MERRVGSIFGMKKLNRRIDLVPSLGEHDQEFRSFCQRVQKWISEDNGSDFFGLLSRTRRELHPAGSGGLSDDSLKLNLAKSIVLDLLGLGWSLKVNQEGITALSPDGQNTTLDKLKEIVRRGHLAERDAQLRQDSVREFIKRMETRRLTSKGWHSIFSLMRDGNELAEKLDKVHQLTDENNKLKAISTVIRPYLHFVDEDPICNHTGLDLREVWRYFRHTWVNAYKPLPGRSMMIVVRDSAAENHPVIGIAALGSSIVQQTIRDAWIGWDDKNLIQEILEKPTTKHAKWLLDSLDKQISSIYLKDLIQEKICYQLDIEHPTDLVIGKLSKEANDAIQKHREFPNAALSKIEQKNQQDGVWERQARTKLFRSKRCGTLASLLKIRQAFQETDLNKGTKKELKSALEDTRTARAISKLVRMIKAEHVGIDMMDITVCGSVAPYNTLLGGKLVCMLLCSPEVVNVYSKKYEHSVSIIASSMKGEPVVRKPRLVLLTTTSLYGTNSSQYNRLKIPSQEIGGIRDCFIEYKKVGKSEGFGTYHFSGVTINLIEILIGRKKQGRRVNSIFGEGVNPRMRKIREGVRLVGFPQDKLLTHGNKRIVYAVQLAKNFRQVLLGLNNRPKYFLPLSQGPKRTSKIANYWYKRWLLGRLNLPGILNELRNHTLSYPITHGARVQMPIEEEYPTLFS